ncbi:MAG: hypothetical protein ACK4N5_03575 [Myxococcales bacterium]
MPLLVLLAALATAKDDAPRPHVVSLGASTFSYTGFFRASARQYALDLRYQHRLNALNAARPLSVGDGLRRTGRDDPGWPLELYAAANLQGELGYWAPAAGFELGYSGYTALTSNRPYRPGDFFQQEQETVSPVYVGFNAAPLRFRVSRVLLSALEVQLGTTVLPLGAAYRIQLGLLHVGVTL